jgi:hypothetical protein
MLENDACTLGTDEVDVFGSERMRTCDQLVHATQPPRIDVVAYASLDLESRVLVRTLEELRELSNDRGPQLLQLPLVG